MSARILDGTAIAQAIRAEVAEEVARLSAAGRKPGLAAVLVGEDPASAVYVRSKGKACEEAGMHSVTLRLPASTTEAELLETVDRLNADLQIHWIMVQRPIPNTVSYKHLRAHETEEDCLIRNEIEK
jgi:methylenetetrahydrofolate dehydrogenase (NADP+)/methenyltetrahydrofolate cyclohydrolase